MRLAILVAIYMLAAAALFATLHSDPSLPDGVLPLNEATVTFPANDPAPVALPHDWRNDRGGMVGWAVYDFTFSVDTPAEALWAVYTPRHRFAAAYEFNGEMIGGSGRMTRPISRSHISPLLLTLPPSLIREGENRLRVTLVSDPPGYGFLESSAVGPYALLEPLHNRAYFRTVTANQIILAATVFLGLLIGAIWLQERSERAYAYFAAMCFSWSLNMSNLIWTNPPLPVAIWERIAFLSLFWTALFGFLFVTKSTGAAQKGGGRALALGLGATTIFAVMPFYLFMTMAQYVLMPAAAIIGVIAVTIFARNTWGDGGATRVIMSLTGALILGAAFHDLLVTLNMLDSGLSFVLPYSALFLFGSVGGAMINRFVGSIREVDQLNRSLEQRLAERESALEESYADRRQIEHRNAAHEERERMMRDLHDGLGSRLVSLLRLSERGAETTSIAQAAKEALRELRFIAAPMRAESPDIPTLLAVFREERLRTHEEGGLSVKWEVDEIRPMESFSSPAAAHLLRVLDEALSNALYHGSGQQLDIALANERSGVRLTVANPVTSARTGTLAGAGLANMRHRAMLAGARFRSGVRDGSFYVDLFWPTD